MLVSDFLIFKWKEPSPLIKPATQKGSGIPLNLNSGLLIKATFRKAFFKLSERPQLREPFKPINFKRPFSVKCSLCLMISKHCLNIK
jgi:hypothetical protein